VSAYEGLRGFETQGQMFALDEMSSDALVGPTRGGDWDDNGVETNPRTHMGSRSCTGKKCMECFVVSSV
jgi:hypothetical protein